MSAKQPKAANRDTQADKGSNDASPAPEPAGKRKRAIPDNAIPDRNGPLKGVPESRIPSLATLSSWLDLTEREQAFVVSYCKHRKGPKAAVEAGIAKSNAHVTARRWLSKPQVQACLLEIAARAAMAAEVNLTNHLHELAEIRDKAKEKGDFSPAVRAEELRGKTAGFYKDIVELRPGQNLADDELAQRIANLTGEDFAQVQARLATQRARPN